MIEKRFAILADPESESWGFAQRVFDNLRLKSDEFTLDKITVKEFRDGEIKPRISDNIRGRVCFFIHDSNKNPSRWFLELCLINEALKKSAASEIIDILPYFKFARQDRKDEPRVPISAEVVADVIELYADGVLTLDVHTPAIDGFFKIRFDNLHSFESVVKYLKEKNMIDFSNMVVMSPDAGGAARANSFAKYMGINDIAIGYKVRKEAGEVGDFRILGDVKDKDVFIVDDIVDSGNTLVRAAETLRLSGARRIYGYCTHGLFTKGQDYVLSSFDKFYVGDTIAQQAHEKLEVISFANLFAEAIYRVSQGMSLSELFKDK